MQIEVIKKEIDGVFEINNFKFKDHRGTFLNLLKKECKPFESIWGNREVKQINISNTKNIGTVRGMHFQSPPYEEAKLISCIKGKVWDVAVDLRKDSPTFSKWCYVELSSKLNNSILIPEGCAHGFQTLSSDCELIYIHSQKWFKEYENGVNYRDKILNISWPMPQEHLSKRDINLPFLEDYDF